MDSSNKATLGRAFKSIGQTFGALSGVLLDLCPLSIQARAVLLALDSFANEGVEFSQARLCLRAGLDTANRKGLRRYLLELSIAGFLEIPPAARGAVLQYNLLLPDYCAVPIHNPELLLTALKETPGKGPRAGWAARHGQTKRKPKGGSKTPLERLQWLEQQARLQPATDRAWAPWKAYAGLIPESSRNSSKEQGGVGPKGPRGGGAQGPYPLGPSGPTRWGHRAPSPGAIGPHPSPPDPPAHIWNAQARAGAVLQELQEGQEGKGLEPATPAASTPPRVASPKVSQPRQYAKGSAPAGWEGWAFAYEARAGRRWIWTLTEQCIATDISEILTESDNAVALFAIQTNFLSDSYWGNQPGKKAKWPLAALAKNLNEYMPAFKTVPAGAPEPAPRIPAALSLDELERLRRDPFVLAYEKKHGVLPSNFTDQPSAS